MAAVQALAVMPGLEKVSQEFFAPTLTAMRQQRVVAWQTGSTPGISATTCPAGRGGGGASAATVPPDCHLRGTCAYPLSPSMAQGGAQFVNALTTGLGRLPTTLAFVPINPAKTSFSDSCKKALTINHFVSGLTAKGGSKSHSIDVAGDKPRRYRESPARRRCHCKRLSGNQGR